MRRLGRTTGLATSAVVHLAVLLLLALGFRHGLVVARPVHLPGTPAGQHLLLSYSPGAPATAASNTLTHAPRAQTPKPPRTQPAPIPPAPSPAITGEKGIGASGDSALGTDNIQIALPQNHPHPAPDLSSLPPGARGDVVVDVVIDETGRVTATTLVRGLGESVDATVIRVLKAWTFTPATRDGKNIASEQEILVHYERG